MATATRKESPTVLREFARSLPDEDIRFLLQRLNDGYQDDLAEVFDFVSKGSSKNIAVDNLLGNASSSTELFSYIDDMKNELLCETTRRNS